MSKVLGHHKQPEHFENILEFSVEAIESSCPVGEDIVIQKETPPIRI